MLLGLYITLVVVSCLASPAGYYDEAIPLVQGRMVSDGHTPHVDFWSFYPPLNYYLNAAAFFLFGRTILAQRLLQAGFYVLVLVGANRFLRSRFPRARLVVECATFLLAVAIGPKFLLPSFIGFSFSLFALFTYFSAYGARGTRLGQKVALAGALTGLTFVSRFNFGAYTAATIFAHLLIVWLLRSDDGTSGQFRARHQWQTVATFFLSMLISWAGLYVLFCGPHLDLAVKQSIIFPQQEMTGLRFVPLQFTSGLAFAVMFPCTWFCFRLIAGRDAIAKKTVIPLLLAIFVLVIAWFRGGNPSVAGDVVLAELAFVLLLHIFVCRLKRVEFSLVLFFACNLHYYLTRADDWHWPWLLQIAVLLIPYLFSSPGEGKQQLNGTRVANGSVLALFVFFVAIIWCVPGFRPSQLRNGVKLIVSGGLSQRISDAQRVLEGTSAPPAWMPIYSDLDELKALRFLRIHTSSKDPVFIGVDNHAEAYADDVRGYWLLDRPIGANYYIFDTDLTIQTQVQQDMIAGLEKNDVRWVILEHDPPSDDSFRQRKYPGSKLLDPFLAANFSEVARFGRFGVLTKTAETKQVDK
ncbi:MAG: hypothetical protein M3Y72_03365 [Acidobacteriota bacterium]|nr:hypothetical protein [Acidobacteriota bacterium]MDQ2840075.1 hypothetical protein [Acidobacteriota bacterium]